MILEARRYTVVAIVLHWAIAAAILANILIGWWMHEAIEEKATAARAFMAFQAHKSIGLTVLLLSLVRLGWRFAHPPPPLPLPMPAWEAFAAKATHWAFYALMIALPLSGWVYVSAGWSPEAGRPLVVPTYYFDLFRVPHLFGLEHAPEATRAGVAGAAVETHEALVWAALALLALHVGAAFKHWLFDRDAVLPQMAPGLPALGGEPAPVIEPARRNALIGAGAAVALAALAIGAFINRPIPAPTTSSLEAAADVEVAEPGESDEAVAPSADAAESADAPTPARWRVDHALSAIEFGGDQGGQPFSGRFGRWSAEIVFDPDNLEASSAVVTIQTSSAADGVPQHDEALPGPEWFDVARFPTATFRTTRIRHRGGDQYEARGLLSVRDQSVRVRLPFTLTIEDGHARMAGQLTLDRRALGLGVRSLADEYVSEAIAVRVAVEADRAS